MSNWGDNVYTGERGHLNGIAYVKPLLIVASKQF